MDMTPKAKLLWQKIPREVRPKILNNVWCGKCGEMGGIGNVKMTVDAGDLILNGICTTCSGPVCRLVEQP